MAEQELKEEIKKLINQFKEEVGEAIDYDFDRISRRFKQAGYVQLAEGQEDFPKNPALNDDYRLGYFDAQQDMLKANWRKVEIVATTKEG